MPLDSGGGPLGGIASHATEAEIADVSLTETSVYLNGVRIPAHGVAVSSEHASPRGTGGGSVPLSQGTLSDAAAAAAAARRGRRYAGEAGGGADLRRSAHLRAAGADPALSDTLGTTAGGLTGGRGELAAELRSALGRGAHAAGEHAMEDGRGGWVDPSASQTLDLSRTALLRKQHGSGDERGSAGSAGPPVDGAGSASDAHGRLSAAGAAAGPASRGPAHLHKVDFRRESLRVKPLGHGASGTVTLVVHVPTLTLLAAKTIPVTDAEKRHNVGMEFTLMYEAMANFADHVGTRANCLTEELALASLQRRAERDMEEADAAAGADAESPAAPAPLVGSGACPYLVSFYDAFSDAGAGTVTFVMEYMNAGTLEQFVDTGGLPDEGMIQWITWQCLKGLEWMHSRGVLHRDIKAANVLVSTSGDVKLSDLGISKRTDEAGLASTVVGTVSHMAPERVDEKPYDAKSDVWSLGLVLLSVAEGRGANPYEGKNLFEVTSMLAEDPTPSLSKGRGWTPEAVDFVDACLRKRPEDRASVAELLEHPWLAGVGERVLRRKADRLRAWISSASDAAGAEAVAGVSELARSELHELVEKVQRYRFRAAMTKRLPAMPRVRPSRMRWLARQLDLPPRLVVRAFRKTQDKINAKLEQIARRRREAAAASGGLESGAAGTASAATAAAVVRPRAGAGGREAPAVPEARAPDRRQALVGPSAGMSPFAFGAPPPRSARSPTSPAPLTGESSASRSQVGSPAVGGHSARSRGSDPADDEEGALSGFERRQRGRGSASGAVAWEVPPAPPGVAQRRADGASAGPASAFGDAPALAMPPPQPRQPRGVPGPVTDPQGLLAPVSARGAAPVLVPNPSRHRSGRSDLEPGAGGRPGRGGAPPLALKLDQVPRRGVGGF